MIALSIGIAGDQQVARYLLHVGARGVDATPAFEAIMLRLEQIEAEQFGSEGAHGGGEQWEQLSPVTIARKKAAGKGAEKILSFSGDLRRSLTDAGDGDAIRMAFPNAMKFGSNLKYAEVHQTGNKAGTLPRRRPIELQDAEKWDAGNILRLWIVRGVIA